MKKSFTKQVIWLFVCLLIISLVIAGCGGNQAEQQGGDSSQTAGQQEAEKPSEADNDDESAGVEDKLAAMEKPDNLSYEMVFSSQGYNITSKVWIKGEQIRVEGSDPMGGSYIMLDDGEYSYMLNPEDKTGVRFAAEDNDDLDYELDDELSDGFGDDLLSTDYDWAGMGYLGEETVNGMKALVFDDLIGGMKIWVHAEYGFPIRMEGKEEGNTFLMEVTSFKVDGVPASIFEIPSEYEIMEF